MENSQTFFFRLRGSLYIEETRLYFNKDTDIEENRFTENEIFDRLSEEKRTDV